MTRPLYDLPPAQPMNARLWRKDAPNPPITPVGDVKNAASARDVSSAIAGAPLTGMLIREDLRVPKEETTMARTVSTEAEKETRREALRAYLVEHGATARKDLLVALGYPESEKGYYQLRTDCEAIGASSESRQGPVALSGQSPVKRPKVAPAEKPAAEASPDVIRPDLAKDAIRYIQEAALRDSALHLPADYCRALLKRFAEVGL